MRASVAPCSEKRYTVKSSVKKSSIGALAAAEALGTVTCRHPLFFTVGLVRFADASAACGWPLAVAPETPAEVPRLAGHRPNLVAAW